MNNPYIDLLDCSLCNQVRLLYWYPFLYFEIKKTLIIMIMQTNNFNVIKKQHIQKITYQQFHLLSLCHDHSQQMDICYFNSACTLCIRIIIWFLFCSAKVFNLFACFWFVCQNSSHISKFWRKTPCNTIHNMLCIVSLITHGEVALFVTVLMTTLLLINKRLCDIYVGHKRINKQ